MLKNVLSRINGLAAAPRYVGRLEGVVGRYVCGWVVDRHHPRARVRVEIVQRGHSRHLVAADVYRADVQKAGQSGDGYCGFRVPLSFFEDASAVFVKLSPRHRLTRLGTGKAPTPFLARHGSMRYSMSRLDGSIVGTAVDLDDGTVRRRVTLVEADGGSTVHAACRYDPTARQTAAHDGFNGFRIPYAPTAGRIEDAETGFVIASWSR